MQQIEDAFSDLDLNSQSRMLETLSQLHRWSKRERSRSTPEPYASAPSRLTYTDEQISGLSQTTTAVFAEHEH